MNTRKVLLILTLALLTTFNAVAYDKTITIKGISYSYNDSTATVESQYNPGDIKYKKSITIPETIKGWDKKKRIVTGIGWQAFKGYSIESIKLPKTIRNIDASAFEDCWRLKSIGLPEGLQSIGRSAFEGCSSLKVITIPEGVQSIEYSTFKECSSLEHVGIPEGITIGGCAFKGCRRLKTVIVIHYNAETSTNNKSDEKPHIGNSAFRGCSSLEYLEIPEGIESIEYGAFMDCTKLQHITFPNSLKSIGSRAFTNNSRLSGIVLPDSLYSLEGDAFGSYTDNENYDRTQSDYHETLQIPQSVRQINNIQSSYSFTGKCYWDIKLDGYNTLSYTKQDTPVVIPDFTIDNLDFKINDDKRSVTLVSSFFRQYNKPSISIPTSISYQGIDYLVTAIDKGTFVACPNIERITLPDSLKTIGDFAFADCKRLKNIQFPYSLDSIGNSAFLRCTALEAVAFPAQISKLSPGTFSRCENLKYVNLNNISTIGRWAFHNCLQLKQVAGSEIEDIEDHAFGNCKRLTTIDLRLAEHIGERAFDYATSLSTVALPNIKTLGNNAFVLCFSLKQVFLSEDLSVIPESAFKYCNNLEYINIENIKEFGDNAFNGCDALWDYSIPEGAKVGKDAFKDCGKKLRDMIAEEARQKQIQEQQAKQQIIEQQAEIERQNRLNAWIQMAETLGQVANSLNQAINHNSSRSSVVTTTGTAQTGASTPHTSTQSRSSNTTKKGKVSPHMSSLAHTYQNWISRLIDMNAHYEKKYNNSDRIRYQKEARSVRQLAEQYDNCSVFKSSWEDWDGRKKR